MKIIKLEENHYLIDESKSVGPDDGWALEILPDYHSGHKRSPIRLVTPQENKSCQSINQADFWNKIIASTEELEGVELMKLTEMLQLIS